MLVKREVSIVFRVDSSGLMGSGHLMRCLTLANELRRCGAKVCFVSRLHPGHLIHCLEADQHVVHKLPAPENKQVCFSEDYAAWLGVSVEQDMNETLGILDGHAYDWLVVDHYGLSATWESAMRVSVNKVMVIDDIANRSHDCDLLLDQNYFGSESKGRYADLVSSETSLLLGPRFALLAPKYAELRRLVVPSVGCVQRVLVFLGNVDQDNQTAEVLKALSHSDLKTLSIDVVVGSNHPDPVGLEKQGSERGGVTLHYNLPTLADLMMRSDLVISAGGATTWERMCLGRPSIMTCIVENQQALSQQLEKNGYQRLIINEKASSDIWYQAISDLVRDTNQLQQLSKKSMQLVDGLGAVRVVDAMLGKDRPEQFQIRSARIDDEALLFGWANHISVREQSFNQELIEFEAHTAWYKEKLRNANCLIFIAEDIDSLPLGQVRFDVDVNKRKALIDISIDFSCRGRGVAAFLLTKGMEKCLEKFADIQFIAEVKSSNTISQALFKKVNFKQYSSKANVVQFEYQQ